MKIKKSLLAAILLLSITSTVNAEDGESLTTANVNSGDFTVISNPISFPAVRIDTSKIAESVSSSVSNVVVDDTGKGDGWIFSASSTPLVSNPVEDKTVGSGTYTVQLPASVISVEVWSAYLYESSGMVQDPTYGPKPVFEGSRTLGSESIVLVKADKGFGMGRYMTDMQYTLKLPKQGSITNITNSESKLTEGADTGLVATEYTATVMYTLSSGI